MLIIHILANDLRSLEPSMQMFCVSLVIFLSGTCVMLLVVK